MGIFIVNFGHISDLYLVSFLLTLNRQMFAGVKFKGTRNQRNFLGSQCYTRGIWKCSKGLEKIGFWTCQTFQDSKSGNWNCYKISLKITHNSCEPQKTPLLKLIYIAGKTACSLRSTHNWIHSIFSFFCDSYKSWSTRFVSLKPCVGFSIFDSASFLLKFIFLFYKIHGLFDFKTS